MKITMLAVISGLCGALLFLNTAYAANTLSPKNNLLTIVYTGNLDGELEPCGCSLEGDFGGIRRQATLIDRLRKKKPHLFLISSGGFLRSESVHDRLTGEYILKGVNALKYDAIGVQWTDLAYGVSFIQETPDKSQGKSQDKSRHERLPWVASNWNDATFESERRIIRNDKTLAFFNWIDPRESPQRQMQVSHEITAATTYESDDNAPLLKSLQRAKQEGATTVLSTTLKLDDARQRFPLEHVDILLVRAAYEKYAEPKKVENTLVLQPGSRGMRLAELDVILNTNGTIKSWQHRIIPLPKTIPDAKRLAGWYKEYNARVKEDYEKGVQLAKAAQSGASPYAGDSVCQTCHAAEHKIWHGSRHGHAYDTLRRVNKAFDPNCITCHTVGFNASGGFIDNDTTPHLSNVQCESCHGSARLHATSGGAQPVANVGWPREKICAQCHTQAHSPAFNMDVYWPRIQHKRAPPP